MAIDPKGAAHAAIVAHLAANVAGIGAVRRGWPEHGQDFNLSGGPILTVSSAAPLERAACSAKKVDSTGSPTVTVTYRTAWLTGTVQIDLFAAYRAKRDEFVPLVQAALNPDVPHFNGLRVTSAGYHNRPVNVTVRTANTPDTGEGSTEGEWRYTWVCDLHTDEVVTTDMPVGTEVRAKVTTSTSPAADALTAETTTHTYT